MSIEYNGVNIFDDGDAPSDVVIERGSDGSGVFFHVCCGCHKTHAVTVRSGLLAFTMRYEMPDLADAEKIAASVSAVKEKDLLVFERANDDARAEIERLRGEIVKERLNTEVAAEMVRELKARPQPGEVDYVAGAQALNSLFSTFHYEDQSERLMADARAIIDAATRAAREGEK